MTTPYDPNYDPAAPILTAALSGVVRPRPQVRLPALIDTGADVTAVPNAVVRRLRLYAVGRMEVEDAHAHVETVDIYTIRVSVAGLPAREMEVVPTEQPFAILGRDWLEQ